MEFERILIVEDNRDLAALQAVSLETQVSGEPQVRVVYDGAAARSCLETGWPQLVLLDLTIPPPDGLSLLKWMSGRGEMPEVIVSSGCSEEAVQRLALRLGAKYFMVKPYRQEALLHNIRALQEKADTEEEKVKREYLRRVREQLCQMTDRAESEGLRYVMMGAESYYEHGKAGITIKALCEKADCPIKPNTGNTMVEAAIYRFIGSAARKGGDAYRELCKSCGVDSAERLPCRKFLTALYEAAMPERTEKEESGEK